MDSWHAIFPIIVAQLKEFILASFVHIHLEQQTNLSVTYKVWRRSLRVEKYSAFRGLSNDLKIKTKIFHSWDTVITMIQKSRMNVNWVISCTVDKVLKLSYLIRRSCSLSISTVSNEWCVWIASGLRNIVPEPKNKRSQHCHLVLSILPTWDYSNEDDDNDNNNDDNRDDNDKLRQQKMMK